LQQGVKRGVLGTHFKVYIQHYYVYLVRYYSRRPCSAPASFFLRLLLQVISSQRKDIVRKLEPTSLAFITATAAFGYARGSTEFDDVRSLLSADGELMLISLSIAGCHLE